jgi:hypothetical protein
VTRLQKIGTIGLLAVMCWVVIFVAARAIAPVSSKEQRDCERRSPPWATAECRKL